MTYKNKLKGSLKNPYLFQYFQLLFSTGLMMILQFAVTTLLTNNMPTEDFADYKQILNTLLLFQSLLLFGWPFTISYLIAKCKEGEEKVRKYIGAGFRFICIVVGIVYAGVVVLCAAQKAFNFSLIPNYWIFCFPIALVPLLQYYLEYVCMGTNRIKMLSIEKLFTQLFAIVLLLALILLLPNLTMEQAIIAYGVSHLSVLLGIFYTFHPILRQVERESQEVKQTNKTVGFPTYLGGLCSVASVRLVTVIVAAFTTRHEYAYFSLGVTISTPLGPIVSSLGSILYKKFSAENKISSKFLKLITATVVVIAAMYVLAIQFLTPVLFGAEYANSVLYAQLIGIGSLMVGFADVFNRFLGSKGEGKAIQHGAMATGLANVLVSIAMMPSIGALGACLARVVSDITYLLIMVIKYRKFVSSHTN